MIRTFREKLAGLREQAIRKYMSLIGTKEELKRLELEDMTTGRLMDLVDHEIVKARRNNPHCGDCVHLEASDYAKTYGMEHKPHFHVCRRFLNERWKQPERKRKEVFCRKPANRACPNFERGDNDFHRARREKGKD